jgi:hypothetical protein
MGTDASEGRDWWMWHQDLMVMLRLPDPNPFPRFHLFRLWGR